ncbi:MAG TPA: CBS domain-containing protein [Candidatus Saccharimonadales bacterium]|nr:CBS domain-containing protein [Candidatus Saccharimonadales bacterium]
MTTGMIIVCILIFFLLIATSSIAPTRTAVSLFELKRRTEAGDAKAASILERENALEDILSLLRVLQALLLVIFVTASVAAFGWLFGVIIAVLVALEYGRIARIAGLGTFVERYYEKVEPHILTFVTRHTWVGMLFRSVSIKQEESQLESREELDHLVSKATGILSADERRLISESLQFDTRTVESVMTPRAVIESIPVDEVLGPLVLSDLHKTGHSRFPVVNGDIDHVVGMLYIQNLLVVNAGSKSSTVKKSMEPRVFYIKNTQTLRHALAAFLRTRHHLFIVVNEFQETVGLITLEDVIESLLGKKIVDEFDAHEDLRVVAARNPHGNNISTGRKDV